MPDSEYQIIGVDCATQSGRVGLARGRLISGDVLLDDLALGSAVASPEDWLLGRIREADATLLALDAPLGWPEALSAALPGHQAGAALDGRPNDLFRRKTDRFVHKEVGKLPLDVGADRIARTAHWALALLASMRQSLGLPIPLAWKPTIERVMAIEVYPAGTLLSLDVSPRGYKGPERIAARRRLVAVLSDHMTLPADPAPMWHNDDILDAAIAVLAGADFLRNFCHQPADLALAQKEGWIWVRAG
jgi:predicted RNase H-like nuclease